ncbi:Holliday junction branch migration DNA helicase RuvB [bacterium]|nr:Holliday junction branch migration DNA helicase RuvB [bacterium]
MSKKEKLPLEDLNSDAVVETIHENALRPKHLQDYVGQKAVTSRLEVFMAAARARNAVLDHVLLSGPPGLGKTTLAHIVAHEMRGNIHVTSGPTLSKPVDLLSILSNLKQGDVLFIDEIHRLSNHVEEALYPAIEDFQIQVILGEGAAAQAVTLPVKPFTLVGATTQAGRLTGPLRDRFGIHLNLDFYSKEEMVRILKRSAKILGIELSADEFNAVAGRSRGTPRITNRLLARVRDILHVMENGGDISAEAHQMLHEAGGEGRKGAQVVHAALDFLDVDELGLQPLDRSFLKVLIEQFNGGPAGIESIAASLSEDRRTLEETVEPFLLKTGFLLRTPRGRVASHKAYKHLGAELPASAQPSLDL